MTPEIKRLEQLLTSCDDKVEKVKLKNKLSFAWVIHDHKYAERLAQESLEEALILGNIELEAQSYSMLAHAARAVSDFSTTLDFLQRALSIHHRTGNRLELALTRCDIGAVYVDMGKMKPALKAFLQCQGELEENEQNNRYLISVYMGLASVYQHIGDYATALKYNVKALELCERINHRHGMAITISNISINYALNKDYEQAIEYTRKGHALFKKNGDRMGEAYCLYNYGEWVYKIYKIKNDPQLLDESKSYYYQALEIFQALDRKDSEAMCLTSIGENYAQRKDYDQALKFLIQALHVTEEIDNPEKRVVEITLTLGTTLRQISKFTDARRYLERGRKLAEENDLNYDLRRFHYQLSLLFESLHDIRKAFDHYRKYAQLSEEIAGETKQKAIAEMEIRFDVDQAKKDQALAEKEKELIRLKNVDLATALEEVRTLNARLSQLNHEKNEVIGIVAHDLKSPLSGMEHMASSLQLAIGSMSPQELGNQLGFIENSCRTMLNSLVKLLDVQAIDEGRLHIRLIPLDLVALTRSITERNAILAKKKDIRLIVDSKRAQIIARADENAARIVFENLLSNALKFSPRGTTVRTLVRIAKTGARVEIQDQGPGIRRKERAKLFQKYSRLSARPTGGESSTGLGLYLVKKHVDAMRGTIRCVSQPGKGARFIVDLPIAHEEHTNL